MSGCRRSDRGLRAWTRWCAAFSGALAHPGVAACLILASLVIAPPAPAADALGSMRARLGDSEMSWHTIVTQRRGETVAGATVRFGPRLTEISIQGHREVEFSSRGAFSIDIRYLGPFDPEAQPMSVDILYMPDGMSGPFWTSNAAEFAPVVRVLALDVWGGVGRIDLLFAGTLCFRKMISAAPDRDNCQEVTGRVETELYVDYGALRGLR